jgi:hypothetical protein
MNPEIFLQVSAVLLLSLEARAKVGTVDVE